MGDGAKQWSGAFIAVAALVALTVLLVVHPQIISSEAVTALYVAFGLRATGLVAHVLKAKGVPDGNRDADQR